MKRTALFIALSVSLAALAVASGCDEPADKPASDKGAANTGDAAKVKVAAVAPPQKLDKLPRLDFNRRAAELNLPIFWRSDADSDKALEPGELAVLWGVADTTRADWVDAAGHFTAKMTDAYQRMTTPDDWSKLSPEEQKRINTVIDELGQGRPSLVETDFNSASAEDKAIVDNVLAAAKLIEKIYAKQRGVDGLEDKITDAPSRQLYYRNQSPFCAAPKTEKDPSCGALAQMPKKASGMYPQNIQGDYPGFCQVLEKRKDADALMNQFVVVKDKQGGKAEGKPATDDLEAVPYQVEYKAEMTQVSDKLKAAAAAITDPGEAAFKAYLEAAAASFLSGDWQPADEAWAKMTSTNSKWYLRIAPDETYSEPCSHKAGFQVSFAKVNPDSLEWQKKLEPHKTEMEAELAGLAGPPYKVHDVTFHLPDFIDMILNAGDARSPTGATIGESLPNWGPVANEGRGRTVAMVNFYTDKDSEDALKEVTSSLLCKASFDKFDFDPKLAVMSTVLHEASHNLGPAHEYKVKGKTDEQIFGGSLASMLEELKAQTSALYFADWLVGKKTVTQAQADGAHFHDVSWAFGHIAQGMVDADGKPKPYSQLASIEMGSLFKAGALAWHADETAANGKDKGCMAVDLDKWKPAIADLEKDVLHVKGAGDKAGALKLKKEFVDADKGDWADMRKVIQERWLRLPKASFVYAINE